MFKQRIIYRLIPIFIIFAVIFVVPFSLTLHKEIDRMISEEERLSNLPPQNGKDIHSKLASKITENIIAFSLYLFVFAFILSLFLSRSLLKPIKELYIGAKSLKEGDLSVRLEVSTADELGEVTRSFNEMAAALEEKTRELRRKETYVSAMMDPLWVFTNDHIITDINPAFTELFGYERSEIIGTSIFKLIDEKNAQIMRSQLDEKTPIYTSTYEIAIIAKDGISIPVLVTVAPIIKDGIATENIGILKDFRPEYELRNAIKESRDYLETIMESIEDELLVVDSKFRIIMANRSAKAKKGDDIVGLYCHSILHGREEPCWHVEEDCPAKKVFATGQIFRTIHKHKETDGMRRFYDVAAYPIYDSAGKVVHVIELMRDITERKEHEENIAQKNRELIAINSIAGILSRSLKAEEIFDSVLNKLLVMMNMDGGGIFLIDEANKELVCTYHKGVPAELVKSAGRVRIGEDIPGRVAATSQLITTPDIELDLRIERSILKHSGIKGYCCIPVKGKEKTVGVFCLFSRKPHIFTAEEERVLLSIGEMTGIAVENIRLYERMQQLYEYQQHRRAEEYKNLISLSSKLAAASNIQTAIHATLNLVKTSFRSDLAWLLEPDNGNLVLKTASGMNIKEEEMIYQEGMSSIEWYAIEKNETVIVPDISSTSQFYLSAYIRSIYRSAVCIPLHVSEKTLGALTLYYVIPKELGEDDIHFLQIVSSIFAVALERSELYEKTISEKERSDTILESISDGIMTADIYGNVITINKAAQNIIGTNQEMAIGKQCCEIFDYSPENTDLRWALGACLDSALEQKPSQSETELTTFAGRKLSLLISSSPVINSKGEVTGVVYILRDITREKEIDRMKTEFVRIVSHQFRTPLSAIVGMTEMVLNEDVTDEKAKEYLQTVQSEGIRLSHMVTDLLNIARIESGREVFAEEDIDFLTLLEDTKRLFSNPLEKKHGKLTTIIEGDVTGFRGDKTSISNLIKNLIENSLIYSDTGCDIMVIVSRNADSIELKVTDNGWGIPEEDIPHLTERFYRGKHGQQTKGTGLGLALCKDIAVRHEGAIVFNSQIGKGTTVIVTFPIRRKQ